MQSESAVHILWDASHIWGLMAWRALRALDVPARLVKAIEIAEGALQGKQAPALLLVPGGSARRRALALGDRGRAAVRAFVADGGNYLGFCGGAGLALSHDAPEDGLGLCPWRRAPYAQRFQHLVSGHVLAALSPSGGEREPVTLPVWWPGRFAPEEAAGGIDILATCLGPGPDLWLADLPLASVPHTVFAAWRDLYGVDLSAEFLAGQPLVISGCHGRGRYVLSYSHLETPDSPAANLWLRSLLAELAGAKPADCPLPSWNLSMTGKSPQERDGPPHEEGGTASAPALVPAVAQAEARVRALLRLGVEQRLFFRRTPWLWGWRAGLPGMACNNLLAALHELHALAAWHAAGGALPPPVLRYWEQAGAEFVRTAGLLADGAEGWLMAARLYSTLEPSLPDAVDRTVLASQRAALFGHPMRGGGLAEDLLTMAEVLICQLANRPGASSGSVGRG